MRFWPGGGWSTRSWELSNAGLGVRRTEMAFTSMRTSMSMCHQAGAHVHLSPSRCGSSVTKQVRIICHQADAARTGCIGRVRPAINAHISELSEKGGSQAFKEGLFCRVSPGLVRQTRQRAVQCATEVWGFHLEWHGLKSRRLKKAQVRNQMLRRSREILSAWNKC